MLLDGLDTFDAGDGSSGIVVGGAGSFDDQGLFREIGKTLETVATDVYRGTIDTVRTRLADALMNSGVGRQTVREVQTQALNKYLPWAILAAVLIFMGGRYAGSR